MKGSLHFSLSLLTIHLISYCLKTISLRTIWCTSTLTTMVSSTTGTTSVTLRPLSGYTPQVSDKLCYTPSHTNSPCLSVTFGTFSRPFDFRNIRILYSSSSTVIIPESQDSLLVTLCPSASAMFDSGAVIGAYIAHYVEKKSIGAEASWKLDVQSLGLEDDSSYILTMRVCKGDALVSIISQSITSPPPPQYRHYFPCCITADCFQDQKRVFFLDINESEYRQYNLLLGY